MGQESVIGTIMIKLISRILPCVAYTNVTLEDQELNPG